MKLSSQAQNIYNQVSTDGTKLGDLRKIAKEIKRDHELAMELWSTGDLMSRQLAVLIMDKKRIDQDLLDRLYADMQKYPSEECNHLADWLMANQLMKDKKLIALMLSWENSPSSIKRRAFWYYQARLRWTGQTPPDNTEELLAAIEKKLTKEAPEVQWAMNFTAGQIGIFDSKYRDRCIQIGEQTGLYKDEIVPPNCTPSYLPKFISIQVEKMNK